MVIKLSKINQTLLKIIRKLEGKLVVIGSINDELLEAIDQNKKIVDSDLLIENNLIKKAQKNSIINKTIYIKNLKKFYHKNKVDYIIANYESILPKMNYFITTSVYINKREIYLFSYNDIDIEFVAKQFNYFSAETSVIEVSDGCLIKIITSEASSNRAQNIVYYIYYYFYKLFEYISNFLVS